jgi:SOS response regulatory protein OraA/RecX
LSDLSYLNDYDYAQRWVVNRLTNRPMGRERLKAELHANGIADTLADRVVAETFREVDEEAVAHRALQTAQRYGRRLTRSQTAHFLRRRGFSEETIDRMIGEKGINEETVHEEWCD